MKLKLLILGGAALALTAGAVVAKTHKAAASGGAYAEPAQPIPYDQVDAYVKGAAKTRAAIVARGSVADTGAAANTSAMAPAAQPTPAMAPAPVNPAPNVTDSGAAAGGAAATQDSMGGSSATPPAPPTAGGTTNAPMGTPQSGPTGMPSPH